jgi:hypothetical protein
LRTSSPAAKQRSGPTVDQIRQFHYRHVERARLIGVVGFKRENAFEQSLEASRLDHWQVHIVKLRKKSREEPPSVTAHLNPLKQC